MFVKGIIEGREIIEEAAGALSVLIPKELKPSSMRNFRPLSLCNAAYKHVSNVLVNRLKESWKTLISSYQASFVPGGKSSDDVIICQEFAHSFKYTKARRGVVMIKSDLEKAYDFLEWDFIEETLVDAGILNAIVGVIMRI